MLLPTRVISDDSSTRRLDLRGHWHVAHLVEEERAAIGIFKLPNPVARRVGERASDVAKQFALQNIFREGRTVEGHKRLRLAGAVLVNRLGDKLFARARLSLDQDGRIRGSDSLEAIHQPKHQWAAADHPLKPKLLIKPAIEF